MKRLAIKAEINKRVWLHGWRHTRISHILANGWMNEAQVKAYFGLVQNSKVLSVYSHVVSQDANRALLRVNGFEENGNRHKEALESKKCMHCNTPQDKIKLEKPMQFKKGKKKIVALVLFILSASVGMLADKIPINGVLLLFPIFAGFFGLSQLLLGIRNKIKVPAQKISELEISRKTIAKSSFLGTVAGSAAGFLPGVGTSEISSLATVDKNDKSFLITLGAITTANTILSILALWLIGRSRSGLAVVIDQLFDIGFGEVLFILFVVLISGGIAVVLTVILAKRLVKIIEKIDYTRVSILVCFVLFILTTVFTGFYGVLLLITCSALGIFTNLIGVKRSILMGVLILPTIFFYLS